MQFAARIRRHPQLNSATILEFARFCALDQSDLILMVLPTLKQVGILDYTVRNGEVAQIEEFVGVSSPFLVQAAQVWNALAPTDEERCAVESCDLAAHAPLLVTDHHEVLHQAGFSEAVIKDALNALEAVGLVQVSGDASLPEKVIYNEYVWAKPPVSIARFLKSLPPNERDVLTRISSNVMHSPGTSAQQLTDSLDAEVLRAAQKVGFIDAPRVITRDGRAESFLFSPTLETELAKAHTTDALHERKLFVAHILFGHRYEASWRGRIVDPTVLVRALLRKGVVGPATAIARDYPLLESFGIVRIEESSMMKGRAFMHLVKEDVVRDGLELLEAALDEGELSGAEGDLSTLWLPGTFVGPEEERQAAPKLRAGPAKEIFDSSIERLREEYGKEARGETF